MRRVTVEEIEACAGFAGLTFTPAHLLELAPEVNGLLEVIRQLRQIDATEHEPAVGFRAERESGHA